MAPSSLLIVGGVSPAKHRARLNLGHIGRPREGFRRRLSRRARPSDFRKEIVEPARSEHPKKCHWLVVRIDEVVFFVHGDIDARTTLNWMVDTLEPGDAASRN